MESESSLPGYTYISEGDGEEELRASVMEDGSANNVRGERGLGITCGSLGKERTEGESVAVDRVARLPSAPDDGSHSMSTGDPYSISTSGPYSVSTGGPHSVSTGGPYFMSTGGPYSISTGGLHSVPTGGPYSASLCSVLSDGSGSAFTDGLCSVPSDGPRPTSNNWPHSVAGDGPHSATCVTPALTVGTDSGLQDVCVFSVGNGGTAARCSVTP